MRKWKKKTVAIVSKWIWLSAPGRGGKKRRGEEKKATRECTKSKKKINKSQKTVPVDTEIKGLGTKAKIKSPIDMIKRLQRPLNKKNRTVVSCINIMHLYIYA